MLYLTPALTIYLCILAGVLGACMGSFLNCFSWRIVHQESVLHGRSHCDACGHVLGARDLVPVFSYLFSKGKCRYCGRKLSARHMWGELVSAGCFVAALLCYDVSLQVLEAWLFFCILSACAFADLEGYIIPDRFIISGIVLFALSFLWHPDVRYRMVGGMLGGFAVAGGLLIFVLLMEKHMGKEAMGGGDIKLLFLTGLFLGWERNLLCLLIACIFGILTGLFMKRQDKAIPWGPSIAAAAWIVYLFGNDMIIWYLSLF